MACEGCAGQNHCVKLPREGETLSKLSARVLVGCLLLAGAASCASAASSVEHALAQRGY
jgi:hypothetical protein